MIYRYRYVTHSSFSPAIEWHFFKLRAIPCNNEFQHVGAHDLFITPACHLYHSKDGQGNAVQWGSFDTPHSSFEVVSEGVVVQTEPYLLHEKPAAYYLVQTKLTEYSEEMLSFARERVKELKSERVSAAEEAFPEDSDAFAVAIMLMHAVHAHLNYTPCHTSTTTTAKDVFTDPRGVCQDYAHLMIALCRALGLHARYVNGFIAGEGQTHAWVEVSDGQVWRAYDPTHDIAPSWGYVKIAHGRDADDCPTNRGRIYSWTQETMTVSVSTQQGPPPTPPK